MKIKNISNMLKLDMVKHFLEPFSAIPTKLRYGKSVIFESGFEGGNLHSVFRDRTGTFFLFLENDMNTHGYNQWFNFYLERLPNCTHHRFIIVNITKQMIYHPDMKLLSYRKSGWAYDTPFSYYKTKFYKR